ncbi:hypothetical protein C8J57DRAFT_1038457, partial [Mycena rebaudengoi]
PDLTEPLSPLLSSFFHSPSTPSPTFIPLNYITMAAVPQMPARGDRNAPQFESQKPRELQRYFTDLEFHFMRAAVTDSTEKKQHATRFLSVDDQDIWESLPEFKPVKLYAEFKAAVLKLYPGNDTDRKYSLADLDALIGEYARVGILSKSDYSEFYRQFLVITQYLLDKNRLSVGERSRAFRRAITPQTLWARVHQRLQIKQPDVHEDEYDIADLNEAVEFILAPTATSPLSIATPRTSLSSQNSEIKLEAGVSTILETMNGILKVLTAQQQQLSDLHPAPQSSAPTTRPDGCAYCSDLAHFIARCPHVDTDCTAGKCKRDVEGRVTLPSGAFVPRRINGRNLRDRIEEWHCQNPGQLGAAQLMLGVAMNQLSTSQSSYNSAATFQLSEEERLGILEREIFAIHTRAQARAAAAAGEPMEQPEHSIPPPTSRPNAPTPALPNPVPPAILRPPYKSAPTPAPPQHPFSNSRDAAYTPPRDRNIGARPDAPSVKKSEPAYRTTAPIFDEKIAHTVFDRSMDVPVTITQRELLPLSPEVRAQVRDATSSRRVTPNAKPAGSAPSATHFNVNDVLPYIQPPPELPADAIIIPDPYENYYNSGDIPEDLVISMESSAIRAILPIVDNRHQVECIIDGGSQIIAMSEAVCLDLVLPYDPCIVLKMQSANG